MRANTERSEKSVEVAFLLCVLAFMGFAGLHRFYTGKTLTGILWLFTCGLLGVGTLFDMIRILEGSYKTKDGSDLYWLWLY